MAIPQEIYFSHQYLRYNYISMFILELYTIQMVIYALFLFC